MDHVPCQVPCSLRRPSAVRLIATLLIAAASCGCHWFGLERPLSGGRQDLPESADLNHPATEASAGSDTLTRLEDLLVVEIETRRADGVITKEELDGWFQLPASTPLEDDAYRWRHTGLQQWLSLPNRFRPPLDKARRSLNKNIAATAIIGSARFESGEHVEPLIVLISTPTLPIRSRRAAIETLARLDDPTVPRHLDELLNHFGVWSATLQRTYYPELHLELLRGFSRHIRPWEDERFVDALRSPDFNVRVESLSLLATGDRLPTQAIELIGDSHSAVRIAALRSVAQTVSVDAIEEVRRATNDNDLAVRLAAIDALGILGGEGARETLLHLVANSAERVREASIAALAVLGDRESVLAAAEDDSWRVRRAVGVALADWNSPQAAQVAKRLLADQSVEVQTQTIESISKWPLPISGPLLLEVSGSNVLRSRTAAFSKLAEKWPPAADVAHGDFVNRRTDVLSSLLQTWQENYGSIEQTYPTPNRGDSESAEISAERLDEIQQRLQLYISATNTSQRQEARQALLDVGAELPAALWLLKSQRRQSIPEDLYSQVLSTISKQFAAIQRLQADDPSLRQRAANELAQGTAKQPLGELAVVRLAEVAVHEKDSLVWRSLLEAIDGQTGQAAVALIYAALWNRSGEVRRRACDMLQSQASPQHAPALLGLLAQETEVEVAKAAVRALAKCGPLDDPQPLLQLLKSNDRQLRVEAAAALASLGYSEGLAALERASFDVDAMIRQRAATAMGQLADPLYLSILIRLLDDRDGVRRAALEALPKVSGRDIVAKSDAPVAGSRQKAELWKKWYQDGGRVVE